MESRTSGISESHVLHGDIHEPICFHNLACHMAFVPQFHSRPSVPGDNFKSPVSGIALTHVSSIKVRKSIKKTHRPKTSKSQLGRDLKYPTATSNFLIRVFTSAPGAYRQEWKPAWPSPELKPSFTLSWSLFLAIRLKCRNQQGWSCLL